jgi:lipopolysaccharide biosynthesis regulator YciM
MEFELWWLLALPVFFGMGWVAARVDLKSLLSESRALPSSYFRGLNFLLNEQPDKAIESFLQVAKENPQTVELQFALGSLFRRAWRGRPRDPHAPGPGEARRPARRRAGARPRSSSPGLLQGGPARPRRGGARQMAEADPSPEVHASSSTSTSRRRTGKGDRRGAQARGERQAQLPARDRQLPLRDRDHRARARAQRGRAGAPREALESNRKCVRANLLRGEWLARDGRHERRSRRGRRSSRRIPHTSASPPRHARELQGAGPPGEGPQLLRGLQHRYPGLDLLNVVYQATAEHEGDEAAWSLVRDEVRPQSHARGPRSPDRRGARARPAERRQDLQLMKNLVHSHAQALAVYLCANCGFKARQFFWQCPACGGWETFPPRRTAELDTAGRHLARMQIGQ